MTFMGLPKGEFGQGLVNTRNHADGNIATRKCFPVLSNDRKSGKTANRCAFKNMRLPFHRMITTGPVRSIRRAVLGAAISCGALSAPAFTPADADTMFEAHTKAFYEEKDGHAWFKESTEGGKVSYWMRAEQLEMVLDAYERTRKPDGDVHQTVSRIPRGPWQNLGA
jgi:hypothetical protein